MYIPDDNGNFTLAAEEGITFSTIVVEGSPVQKAPVFSHSPMTLSSNVLGSGGSHSGSSGTKSGQIPPAFRSITARRTGSNFSFNLKIVLAKMSRGPSDKCHLKSISQTFMDLTEKNARLSDILDYVNACWDDQGELSIVTSDGLCLEDSEGTRGQ